MDNKKVKRTSLEFNTVLIYFSVVVAFVILRILSYYNIFAFMGNYASFYVGLFTQIGLLFLIPLLLFKFLNKCKIKEIASFTGFKAISFKMIVLSIFLGVIVFCLNIYVSGFFNSAIEFLGYRPREYAPSPLPSAWWVLVLNLLGTAVLPAICEEFLHRGLLMRGISNAGMKKSILISGLLFGLLHLNIEQFFYATIIGFFLGYLAYGCNSIYPCMIVHFMNNGISVFFSFARSKGWAVGKVISNFVELIFRNYVLGFVIIFLLLFLLTLLLIIVTKRIFVESFNREFQLQQQKFASDILRQTYFQSVENIKEDIEERGAFISEENAVFVDAEEFLKFVKQNIDKIVKEAGPKDNRKFEIKSKIFLWGTIALGVIITIMTFIWGLL